MDEYQDITLTVDGLNECEIVKLAGRRVVVKILYNSVHRRFNELIQFSISTQFNCQKHFYFKLFNLVKTF